MADTGKRFIRKANDPTVYMREGNSLRPIQSMDEFQMLSGTRDVNSVTDVVDNLDAYNRPVGAYQGLTDAEKANYLTTAQNQYAGTRKQFADLISGKLQNTDAQFADTQTRLNRGAEDAITGATQDLSNRGFLRSGEQVDKTVRFKQDAATNIGRADIQRQIDRANLLLEQTNFESDLNKQAIGDANTAIGNETTQRQNAYDTAIKAQESEKARLAQTWDTATALQASREDRAFKREQLKLELAKIRASNGSGGLDIMGALDAWMKEHGMVFPTNPGSNPSSDPVGPTDAEKSAYMADTPEQKKAAKKSLDARIKANSYNKNSIWNPRRNIPETQS